MIWPPYYQTKSIVYLGNDLWMPADEKEASLWCLFITHFLDVQENVLMHVLPAGNPCAIPFAGE